MSSVSQARLSKQFWTVLISLVLSNIVVCSSNRVQVNKALKSRIWKVFLVLSEGNSLLSKQVKHRRHVGWDPVERIVVHSKIVTTVNGTVVGLRRVSITKVVCESDTLLGKESHVG
jgi:hypothetical protein